MLEQITKEKWCIIICVVIVVSIFIYYMCTCDKSKPDHDNMQNNTQETPVRITLYNFYSPECGPSREFIPTWNIVAERIKKLDVDSNAVNCLLPENDELAFYYNIKYWPTVILVTRNKNIEYDGPRTADDLYNFVEKNMKS